MNIVWWMVDSIRGDHTSLCKYARNTTPELVRIAGEDSGSAFTKCFSHGIWSPSAAASVLTGVHPEVHGVGGRNSMLPAELNTVPELLAKEGYDTVGLSGNPWFSSNGLERGFETFIDPSQNKSSIRVQSMLKFLLNIREYSAGFSRDSAAHRADYLIQDMARSHLKQNDRPTFIYLHTKGAHSPWQAPPNYASEFLDGSPFSVDEVRSLIRELPGEAWMAGEYSFTDQEESAIIALYDALVKSMDVLVGEFFDWVRTELDNTILVITSDHGEPIFDYGLVSHKMGLYDPNIHVPCVVHGLPELAHQESELVGHIDVMQTVLDEVGADTSQFQGINLRQETNEYVIAQRGNEYFQKTLKKIREHDPTFDISIPDGMASAVRSKEYKLITGNSEGFFYRLPDEKTDIAASNETERKAHDQYLTAARSSWPEPITSTEEMEIDNATEERLKDLGYR